MTQPQAHQPHWPPGRHETTYALSGEPDVLDVAAALDGETARLAARGGRLVLVVTWGPWLAEGEVGHQAGELLDRLRLRDVSAEPVGPHAPHGSTP